MSQQLNNQNSLKQQGTKLAIYTISPSTIKSDKTREVINNKPHIKEKIIIEGKEQKRREKK